MRATRPAVRLGVALLVGLAATLPSAAARADTPPGTWDLARDPDEAERWRLHLRVERLVHAPIDEETTLRGERQRQRELHCEAALALLERADAAHSPDVRLRFDLGLVHYELAELRGRLDLYAKAAEILRAAVDTAPDHPGATVALERMVYAYARLDRPREELDAWHRYIPRLLDPRTRAVASMNMGEAEMRLGLLDDALATFREVLRLCGELPSTSSTYVLTLWDLAVALDRSGDARGALETAATAARESAIDSSGMQTTGRGLITRDPAVFFVPAWERQWYLALGSSALARESPEPRDAWAYWAEAEHEWDEYIGRATAAGASERWLPIARLRQVRAHAERLAAEKRVPQKDRKKPTGNE